MVAGIRAQFGYKSNVQTARYQLGVAGSFSIPCASAICWRGSGGRAFTAEPAHLRRAGLGQPPRGIVLGFSARLKQCIHEPVPIPSHDYFNNHHENKPTLLLSILCLWRTASAPPWGGGGPTVVDRRTALIGAWPRSAKNVGRDEKWFAAPRPERSPPRCRGSSRMSLPRLHGLAWYWREFVARPTACAGRFLLRFWRWTTR